MTEKPLKSGLIYPTDGQPLTPEVPLEEPEPRPAVPVRREEPVIPPPPVTPESPRPAPSPEPAHTPKREEEKEPA